MVKIDSAVINTKEYAYVTKLYSVRYNEESTFRMIQGTIILGAYKKNTSFVISTVVPSLREAPKDPKEPATMEVHFYTRANNELMMDTSEEKYSHHLSTDSFTSASRTTSLFVVMDRVGDMKATDGFVDETEAEPDCKTTGLHSTDMNGKCMVCGTQTEKLILT